jgi:flavin reductase (DIM6/NTAB) family NADH-FMN oxidoreductase RutF
MRCLASGVDVVAVFDGDKSGGLTATVACPASANPPHLVVMREIVASSHAIFIGRVIEMRPTGG